MLKREAFETTRTEEERQEDKGKVLSVRLNDEELMRLEEDARLLQQEKPATALKQLAEIGHNVIHDPLMRSVLDAVFKNKRRNERLGIGEADPKFTQK